MEVGKKYIHKDAVKNPNAYAAYIEPIFLYDGGAVVIAHYQSGSKSNPFFIQESGVTSYIDLPKEKVKKEGWINIYDGAYSGAIFDTEEQAKKTFCLSPKIATIHIEWFEEEKE